MERRVDTETEFISVVVFINCLQNVRFNALAMGKVQIVGERVKNMIQTYLQGKINVSG